MNTTPQDAISRYPQELFKMDPIIKALWVTSLLDGNSEQGQGVLGFTDSNGKEKRCCLGVLCDLAILAGIIPPHFDAGNKRGHQYGGETIEECNNAFLPEKVRIWAGLPSNNPSVTMDYCGYKQDTSLSQLNDTNHTFPQIAQAIARDL